MTVLMELEEDATMSECSKTGRELLREAIKVFGAWLDERHPTHFG